MDRARFDGWLRSLIPDEVTRITGRCVGICRSGKGFEVRYRQDGEEKTITAQYIAGADGACSIVRRTFFGDVKIRKYVALQRWFLHDRTEPFYSCVFDRDSSDCCSWSISKDEYMIYGGAFAPAGCRESFERQLESASGRWFSFSKRVADEACMVCRPASVRQIVSGCDGVLLLGEAGGFISPSSLEGISWAMRCAELASKAFERRDPVREYARLTQGLKLKLQIKMLKSVFMYTPFLRRIIMKTGIKSLKNINDERK